MRDSNIDLSRESSRASRSTNREVRSTSRLVALERSSRGSSEISSVASEPSAYTGATPGTQETGDAERRDVFCESFKRFLRKNNLGCCLGEATAQDAPASATQGTPGDTSSAEPHRTRPMSPLQSSSEHPSSQEGQGRLSSGSGGKETAHPGESRPGGSSSLDTQRPIDAFSPIKALTRIEPVGDTIKVLREQTLGPNGLPFMKDDLNIYDIGMGEHRITKASDSQPILKTTGLSTCTSIVLYHPEKKIAGIRHESSWDDDVLDESVNKFLNSMYEHGLEEKDKNTLQAGIFGGRALEQANDPDLVDEEYPYTYYDRLPSTVACLQKHGITNILYKETEDTQKQRGDKRRSIAIDSRTGQIYNVVD